MKKEMKKGIFLLLGLALCLGLCACGAERTVHCDSCGKEVQVDADSNITEDWILFCKECEEAHFGDNPVVRPTN